MVKAPWKVVSNNLDKLFTLPFAKNETPYLRSVAIEAMLRSYQWSWDDVIEQIIKPEGN